MKLRAGIIASDELFESFDPSNEVPSIEQLGSIQFQELGPDAERELSISDRKVIRSSLDAIERACRGVGLLPILVDLSLIIDHRRQGVEGQFGYYHSFCSVNSGDPKKLWEAYIAAIYREHRSSKSDRRHYESIVTHAGMFKDDISAFVLTPEDTNKAGISLPKYIERRFVGAYRYDVAYVDRHEQDVEENIAKFALNLGEEIDLKSLPKETDPIFISLPFRRADLGGIGALGEVSEESALSPPGGVLFLLLDQNNPHLETSENKVRRLVQRCSWILAHAALKEAKSQASQEIMATQTSTSVYGMAHPLKTRWSGMMSDVQSLKTKVDELLRHDTSIAKEAADIHSQMSMFQGWVNLAYLLYYASSARFESESSERNRLGERVFTNSDPVLLGSFLSDQNQLSQVLGEQIYSGLDLDFSELEGLLIDSWSKSYEGRILEPAAYHQMVFEVLNNIARYGGPEHSEQIIVEANVEKIEGLDAIVFKNEMSKKADLTGLVTSKWTEWNGYARPGGLSVISQLLKWTDSGTLFVRTLDANDKRTFETALALRGLKK